MPLGANIELANTFNDWRIRTNEIIALLNGGGGGGSSIVFLDISNTGNVVASNVVSSNVGLTANGTITAPSKAFGSETSLGLFRRGAGDLGIAVSNATNYFSFIDSIFRVRSDSGKVQLGLSDDVAIARTTANTVALQTNGTSRLTVNVTTIDASLPITAPNNSVIGTLTTNSTFVTATVPFAAPDGLVGNPGQRFGSEATGWYLAAAGDLRLSLVGVSALQANVTTFAIQGTRQLTVASAAISGVLGAGNTTVTGTLGTGNTTVTGTLGAGNTTVTGILTATGNAAVSDTLSLSTIFTVNTTILTLSTSPLTVNATILRANVVVRCDTTNGRLVLPVGSNLWAT